jgi:hypothetical protein
MHEKAQGLMVASGKGQLGLSHEFARREDAAMKQWKA